MFQELVSPRARSYGSWYTLPLSFLVHTAAIAIFVVVPLIATDMLPMPRTALEYINDFTPVIPTPPPAALPQRDAAPPAAVDPAGIPLVAPDEVGVESGMIFEPAAIDTQAIDGVINGFGAAQGVIDTPPPVAVVPVEPVRTGGEIKPPARTRYVEPEYPEIARNARVEGVVIIEAIIDSTGKVENARVLRSAPLLDSAALAAVRAWEYTPTLLNGRPTPVIMTVTVRFDLN
jgi:protein TonB